MAVEDIEFLMVDLDTDLHTRIVRSLDNYELAVVLKRTATEFLVSQPTTLAPNHSDSFTLFPKLPPEVGRSPLLVDEVQESNKNLDSTTYMDTGSPRTTDHRIL